jgi:hypothetical protein
MMSMFLGRSRALDVTIENANYVCSLNPAGSLVLRIGLVFAMLVFVNSWHIAYVLTTFCFSYLSFLLYITTYAPCDSLTSTFERLTRSRI